MIENKENIFFNGVQNVVISEDGNLVDSDNVIIDLSHLSGLSLYDEYPVTESALEGMKAEGKKELYLPRVEMEIDHKKYIFDFYFRHIGPKDDRTFLWVIQDLTKVYKYLAHVQQERNEALVKYERLSSKLNLGGGS